MKVALLVSTLALSAAGAHARLQDSPQAALLQMSNKLQSKVKMDMANSVQTKGYVLNSCKSDCITDVLYKAKNFHATSFATGQCMKTVDNKGDPNKPDNVPMPAKDEFDCEDKNGEWVENIRGGGVDILKNGYKAFGSKGGPGHGCIKMFFTIVAQGFYYAKDQMVIKIGMHERIRDAWGEVKSSVSEGLGAFAFRTEKRSLYDKARQKIQLMLDGPIRGVCNVLPSVSISFVVGTTVHLAELCTSALKTMINHFLGWLKKQIKTVVKNVFQKMGKPEMSRRLIRLLVAPVGSVFLSYEAEAVESTDKPFKELFDVMESMITGLRISQYQHKHKLMEDEASTYCYDNAASKMFEGDDKEEAAMAQLTLGLQKVLDQTNPTINGLDAALKEATELYTNSKAVKSECWNKDCPRNDEGKVCSGHGTCNIEQTNLVTVSCKCDVGYGGKACEIQSCKAPPIKPKKAKEFMERLERMVYVASLVFDPRVANVWSSDMLDALITNVLAQFSLPLTSSDTSEKSAETSASMKEAARVSEDHLNENGLDTRERVKNAEKVLSAYKIGSGDEETPSIEDLETAHKANMEKLKTNCWVDKELECKIKNKLMAKIKRSGLKTSMSDRAKVEMGMTSKYTKESREMQKKVKAEMEALNCAEEKEADESPSSAPSSASSSVSLSVSKPAKRKSSMFKSVFGSSKKKKKEQQEDEVDSFVEILPKNHRLYLGVLNENTERTFRLP